MPPDESLLRFCHPERILATTRLPGLGALGDETLAALHGVGTATYARTHARWRRQVEAAAGALRADPAIAGRPFRPGERILTLGDSITADRQSWAELLALVAPEAEVVNAGLSGDTTTGAMTRMRAAIATRADRVVVLLGTNDARRHGRAAGAMLVSHSETQRNLLELAAALAGNDRELVWLTPPPVLADRIHADALMRASDVTWRAEDVAAKAALVRALPGTVIDLWPWFGDPPAPDLLLPDGLHPSLPGQVCIVRALLTALAA